jgi:phenylacetic acid degradation operon negative regulatory protein
MQPAAASGGVRVRSGGVSPDGVSPDGGSQDGGSPGVVGVGSGGVSPDGGNLGSVSPRLSRRHAAGAESARGLLFTVLGEFVLPSGGTAWTSAFIDVLGRLGVEEKACRQALMRTAADGWLTAERAGRRTSWRLTGAAERLLTEGTERIFGFAAARQDWDGRWVLILARTPETERPARHRLRTRLSWAGFGSPAPGVWLSAHADRVAEAELALADAGVLADAQIFLASHAGGGPLTALARQAWDLDLVEARYAEFLAEFAGSSCADPLARGTELVHAWRRFPWIDPMLPAELLPEHWSGVLAARLFERQHARWAADAMAAWRRLSQLS